MKNHEMDPCAWEKDQEERFKKADAILEYLTGQFKVALMGLENTRWPDEVLPGPKDRAAAVADLKMARANLTEYIENLYLGSVMLHSVAPDADEVHDLLSDFGGQE